jgi:hypothetical protein
MTKDLREAREKLISLVWKALRATEDAIVGEDGRRWQVHQYPQQGVAIALHDVVDGEPTGARVTKFTAAQARHAAYPEDILFVAGHQAFVRQDGGDLLVVWLRDPESMEWPGLTDEMRSALESPINQSLLERLRPFTEGLRGGDAKAKVDLQRVMTELQTEHTEELAGLQSVVQSVFQGPEAIDGLMERFDALVAECVQDGWHAGEPWELDIPFPERGVRLERGSRVREIEATIFGPAQWLLLRDAAA